MVLPCPVELNTATLRGEISRIYGRVAKDPTGDFHFHRGPEYASEFLGYDPVELAALPGDCLACFAGIGNPLAMGQVHPGQTVVDIGCGAGMDLLLAARQAGAAGKAIGIDMTDEMILRARTSAEAAGLSQVEVRKGDATSLPVEDAIADIIISNGVLNLVPEKEKAFAEILRVLRPSGRLQLADIALGLELPEEARRNMDLWTG